MDTSGEPRDESGEVRAATVSASLADGDRAESARGPGGVGFVRPARSLVRVLYTSNPFYILSADLVFAGLRMSFGPGGPAGGSWALAGSLAGYTLVLATTACVLIRLGRLWDDLRTLLLLIVMMFLAIAMSCDDTLAGNPRKGILGCLAGLAFAVVVTEVVLGTIRLRLPGWYRAAYYAILGLVFLYPVALVPLLGDPDNPTLQWALFAFSPMAALAVAMLIPAARRGRAGVAGNGSPWPWPLYPWSLFVILAGALCVRSWSLCVSFHYVTGSRSIFGTYFLVPIGIAVALVWLEIGIAARRKGITIAASVVPMVLACLTLAQPPTDWVYQQFMERFIQTLGGTPAYLALMAAVAFLAYAGVRRVPRAMELMALALAGLAVVGPRTVYFANLVGPRAAPMAAAGLVLAATAWRHRDSRRALLSAACLAIATTRGTVDLWPTADSWPIALHLGVLALMIVGAMFHDGPGVMANGLGAFALAIMGLDASTGSPRVWSSMPHDLIAWYPLVIAGAAWGFGLLVRDRFYNLPAASSSIGWLAHSGTQTYVQLRRIVVGLDQIAWGMLFFLLAMAISLRKAGIWPRPSAKEYEPLLAGEPRPPDPTRAS